jgi:hydroxyethylthiazole kinase-like uncharacterized protein yjeF
MKLFTSMDIKKWDEYTIQHKPIRSLDLMEQAATAFAHQFCSLHPASQSVAVFCGNGNNGGDGLAVARMLAVQSYSVKVYVLSETGSPDFTQNLIRIKQLLHLPVQVIKQESDFPNISSNTLIVDALYGTGLTRPLTGISASLVNYLNASAGFRIAVDMPSGMFADCMPFMHDQVVFAAHETYTFQQPKISFMLAETGKYCGKIHVLDIGLSHAFTEHCETPYFLTTHDDVKKRIRTRSVFTHKGTYGHLLLAGGSFGKMGAACLMAKSALRTGCGLATAYIPKTGYTILQTAVPEAMVITDEEMYELHHLPDTRDFDAVAAGPGMGMHEKTIHAFELWLRYVQKPIVLDADALNMCARLLAEHHFSFHFPANCVLTPHPKEFDRLAGVSSNAAERIEKQLYFAKKYQVVVVLKGAYTSVACPSGQVYFNSTGNPAMATAGSGDVLTGIIGSLLAQGYSSLDAARLGVYIHGLSGDMAAQQRSSLIASDIIEEIPRAMKSLFTNDRE